MSTGSAIGWYDQPSQPTEEHDKDKDHGKDKDKDKDKGGKHEEKPPVIVPPTPAAPPPAAVTPPPAAAPPPVVSQGAPPAPAPEQPVGVDTTPPERGENGEEEEAPTVAQAPSQPALAPVAEREELAKTGIDPGLIALFGAICLIGGGLLFRRALARG
jgi:LPXTG-motif cell wall-anchored protein